VVGVQQRRGWVFACAVAEEYAMDLFQREGTGWLRLPALGALASAPALPVFCYSSIHRLAQSFVLLSFGQEREKQDWKECILLTDVMRLSAIRRN
jgi:hypothetical protein